MKALCSQGVKFTPFSAKSPRFRKMDIYFCPFLKFTNTFDPRFLDIFFKPSFNIYILQFKPIFLHLFLFKMPTPFRYFILIRLKVVELWITVQYTVNKVLYC